MSLFLLLNSDMGGDNWVETWLSYAALGAIILISLIVLGIIKKMNRREASLSKARAKCQQANAYAADALQLKGKRGLLIASTKLSKLCSLVVDAEWSMSCVVEAKKDVVLEGVSTRLDGLASKISAKAEEAFYTEEEYLSFLKEVKAELGSIVEQVKSLE